MDLTGRLSDPVQRRLTEHQVDALVAQYEAGSTIETLAHEFSLHRTTVMELLERRSIPRRTSRKLTDDQVNLATRSHLIGNTLADIAEHLHVSPTTLARELRLAGTAIRPAAGALLAESFGARSPARSPHELDGWFILR